MNFKGITFDLPDTGMLQCEHNSFNSSTAQSWILAMFNFFPLISLWRIAGSPRSNDKINMFIRKACKHINNLLYWTVQNILNSTIVCHNILKSNKICQKIEKENHKKVPKPKTKSAKESKKQKKVQIKYDDLSRIGEP